MSIGRSSGFSKIVLVHMGVGANQARVTAKTRDGVISHYVRYSLVQL